MQKIRFRGSPSGETVIRHFTPTLEKSLFRPKRCQRMCATNGHADDGIDKTPNPALSDAWSNLRMVPQTYRQPLYPRYGCANEMTFPTHPHSEL
ncbi:hypothetical protein [Pseudomonas floridensis]|uniref:hypothetical protein n=1 Tax=Pseudomonas floridensis TaxID=1958950 RepID=UPI0012FFCC13|nr:hypothetical protein [Pseudomonas floridensis]